MIYFFLLLFFFYFYFFFWGSNVKQLLCFFCCCCCCLERPQSKQSKPIKTQFSIPYPPATTPAYGAISPPSQPDSNILVALLSLFTAALSWTGHPHLAVRRQAGGGGLCRSYTVTGRGLGQFSSGNPRLILVTVYQIMGGGG